MQDLCSPYLNESSHFLQDKIPLYLIFGVEPVGVIFDLIGEFLGKRIKRFLAKVFSKKSYNFECHPRRRFTLTSSLTTVILLSKRQTTINRA